MDRALLGKILVGLGLALAAVGVVGLTTGDDETAATTSPPASDPPATTVPASTVPSTAVPASTVPSTAVPASTVPSTTVPASTVPSTTVPVRAATEETVEEFFAVLKGAIDDGDAATILDRMNRATIDRYGIDQCEAYAASIAGVGLDATLVSTSELASWDYSTDDVTTTITGVVAVELEQVTNGQTVPTTAHWQLVDGRFTWFTDCGFPA